MSDLIPDYFLYRCLSGKKQQQLAPIGNTFHLPFSH